MSMTELTKLRFTRKIVSHKPSKHFSMRLMWIIISISVWSSIAHALPKGFVYLRDVAPLILQDMRYAGYHNFIGRPIKGYQTNECVLTQPAAHALTLVQQELLKSNLSLKVYDCYRPQQAVDDFIAWSKLPKQTQMKAEFYPLINKRDLFKLGYVAKKSGHSRGSTMDLTIVPIPTPAQATYHRGQQLTACYAAYHQRFADNSIDMGTSFDCMDMRSHPNSKKVSLVGQQNRQLLQRIMMSHGFVPLATEWWHFTLKNEPYKNTYFNFPIVPKT